MKPVKGWHRHIDSTPGTAPSRCPSSASAQPPARHEPSDRPAAAQWWPCTWTPDLDQYARPIKCPALA
eukprot:3241463-Pyramimonas_sp.AAC.1